MTFRMTAKRTCVTPPCVTPAGALLGCWLTYCSLTH